MFHFRTDPNFRLQLLKIAAAACVVGLHLAVAAAIVARPVQSGTPDFSSPVQVSIVDLLPMSDGPAGGPGSVDSVPTEAKPQTEPVPETVSVPEPVLEPASVTEPTLASEPNPVPEAVQTMADSKPVSEPVANSEPKTEPTPKTEPELAPEPEPEPDPKPELKPEPPPEPEPALKPEPLPKLKPQPQPKLQPIIKPEPTPEPEIKSRVEPKPKPDSGEKTKTKSKPVRVAKLHDTRQAETRAAVPSASAMEKAENQDVTSANASGRPPGMSVAATDTSRPGWITQVAYQNHPPQPRYPRAAQRRGQMGTVIVRVLISSQGDVVNAKVQKSSGHALLDEAALDAVRKARFQPYTENGVRHSARADIPIAFVL